jgi:hypothetical protein
MSALTPLYASVHQAREATFLCSMPLTAQPWHARVAALAWIPRHAAANGRSGAFQAAVSLLSAHTSTFQLRTERQYSAQDLSNSDVPL